MQIPQLTFLRFLAAFGVVLFHFGQTTAPFDQPWLLPLVANGGLGVGFFFTLSGFLMAWVYAPQPRIDLRKYAQTRFARIYPLYLLTFLLALAAEMLLRDTRPRGLSVILQSLGLHAWVPGYSLAINFPAWSVSVELFFYAMFPLLLYGLRRLRPALLVGVVIAVSVLGWVLYRYLATWTEGLIPNPNSDFVMRFPPWHLHSFVVGMVTGLLYRSGKLRLPTKWLPAALFLALSAGLLSLAYFPNWAVQNAGNDLFAPVFALLIVSLAQDQGPLSKALAWQPLQFAGEMSYGVYLLQAPVYIALERIAQASGAKGLVGPWLYAYLLALLFTSALSFQYFERPMRQWLRPR